MKNKKNCIDISRDILIKIFLIVFLFALLFIQFPTSQQGFYFEGWDKELMDIYDGSCISFDGDKLVFNVTPYKRPFITLFTTGASCFTFELDVTVLKASGLVFPIQVAIWQSDVNNNFVILFSAHESESIRYQCSGPMFSKSEIFDITHYKVNSTYHIRVSFLKNQLINFTISNSTWFYSHEVEIGAAKSVVEPSGVVYSTSHGGTVIVTLEHYKLWIPDQPYHSFFTTNETLQLLYLLLLLVTILVTILVMFKPIKAQLASFFAKAKFLFFKLRNNKEFVKAVKALILVFFIQSLLFSIGEHPYDTICLKKWTYICSKFGIKYLYPFSGITPTGQGENFKSIFSATFPYPPLAAYIFVIVGKIYGLFAHDFVESLTLSFILKFFWVLFVDLGGLLIFLAAIKSSFNFRQSLALMLLYTLNPGILFESAIWGHFTSLILLFAIIAGLMITYSNSTFALLFTMLTLLTKQTGVYLSFVLLTLIFAKFSFKKLLNGALLSLITIHLIFIPFVVNGYSPFFLINTAIGFNVLNLLAEKPGEIVGGSFISVFAYNIWPLIAAYLNNQSFLNRFFYPDNLPNQILGMSYLRFATIITVISILFITIFSCLSIRQKNKITFFSLYLVSMTTYMLFTKMHERYLGYTIPFLILAFILYKKIDKKSFAILYSLISFTYFVSMYLTMIQTSIWVGGFSLNNFYPENNKFAFLLYTNLFTDVGITILSLINVAAFIFSLFIFIKDHLSGYNILSKFTGKS